MSETHELSKMLKNFTPEQWENFYENFDTLMQEAKNKKILPLFVIGIDKGTFHVVDIMQMGYKEFQDIVKMILEMGTPAYTIKKEIKKP